MGDAYFSYGGARYQPPAAPLASAAAAAAAAVKRPRTEVPGVPELVGYYPRAEERVPHHKALIAPYNGYLQNGQVPSMPRPSIDDGRMMGVGGPRWETSLPPDATNTLYVEGLPANCTRREVSHVFRPFPGFREVRLVNKQSRHPGDDPWVLCFVDFSTPSQAAVVLDCLQGYEFDQHKRGSAILKLQFSRSPGPKSSGGPHGRR